MATSANISQWKIRKATIASPATYADIEEVFAIGGFGKDNELVDVTNFDSPLNAKEFIAGLADGAEITIECNFVQGATEQSALKTAVESGLTLNFQAAYTGISPEETFDFAAVCKAWSIEPSTQDKNTITFIIKISGNIT